MSAWPLPTARVLIAEDDLDLLYLIGMSLLNAGFDVTRTTNGVEAIQAFREQEFSLMVLDINMPLMNGLEVCAKVRESSNVPIMMLSARDQECDLLDAFDVGADVYMIKPFSPRAFIARIRALLRRSLLSEANLLKVGSALLDVETLTLKLASDSIRLTKLEAKLLVSLMTHAGSTVSTKTLIGEVWDPCSTANRNMLKQMIFRLRRKLQINADTADLLRTMPDGYMWRKAEVQHETSGVMADASS